MSGWSVLYLIAEVLSCVSTLAIVVKLLRQRREAVQSSAVFWTLVWFFCCLAVWTLARAALFAWILRHDHQLQTEEAATQEEGDQLHNASDWQTDAMGMGRINEHDVTDWKLVALLIVGDTAIVGTSLWLVVMARELYKLAKTTMDRGASREKQVAKRYFIAVSCFMALFAGVEVLVTLVDKRYNANFLFSSLTGLIIQIVGLVGVAAAVCVLRAKGRNVEHVHGRFVPSPLYVRIRNLLVVFAVFSLQYQVFVLIFYKLQRRDDPRPTQQQFSSWAVGLSSTLYRLIGVVLSFMMGCSQEWVVQLFGRFMPKEYVDSFANSSLSHLSNAPEYVDPPHENPVFVFTDIESSSALWALDNGEIMRPANELHDDILRSLLLKYRGYEITTAGDAFQLAFPTIKEAVEYCMEAQVQLLNAKWPKKLRKCGVASVQRERVGGQVVFDGVRVRMGIHDAQEASEGKLVYATHPVTGKATYTGLSEVVASKVGDLGHGGQIVVTGRVAEWVRANSNCLHTSCWVDLLGNYHLTSVNEPVQVYSLVMEGLEARVDVFKRAPPRRIESCSQVVVVDYEECRSEEE